MRLTVKDYAARFGLSPRTVRSRLQRGDLEGIKEEDPTNGAATWYVILPDGGDVADPRQPDPGELAGPRQEPMVPFAAYERLHRENLELAGRCGWLQAGLGQAKQTIRQLQAPQPASDPEPGDPVAVSTSQERVGRTGERPGFALSGHS